MHQSHVPDQRPHQPFPPEPSSSSTPYHAPPLSRKRPIQPLEPLNRSTPSTPRAIQPRPPTSGGGPFNGSGSVDSGTQAVQISPGLDTSEPPRKRGRPSKLETQRRMAEARARGEEYPPPKRKPGPKPKNRPTGASPRTTGGGVGGGGEGRGNQLSATTSRLQNAIEMDVPQSSGTMPREPSSTSDRRRKELMDRPATAEQQHQSTEPQNLRPDPTIGSSPRTRLGGGMYPADQNIGGARVIGQGESSGGGGGSGPLSTPRTILESQMSTQPPSSPYVSSYRGVNEMAASSAGPNPSVTQGIGGGSSHLRGQSPTVTMAGEYNPGQRYQITPGRGMGGGDGSGSGGGRKS